MGEKREKYTEKKGRSKNIPSQSTKIYSEVP
jgi:hypothetical protein